MSRTRTVLAVLVLLSVPALVGCTDDDPEPKFGPTESATAPTSPSTTVAAPVLDPEETVRAWVDARNAAMADGDLSQVRAITSSTCSSCDGILDPIQQVYDDGGEFDTDGWKVAGARLKTHNADKATVSTGLEFAAGRTVPEAGAEPVEYDAEKHIVIFRLTKTAGTWRVSFVGFLS